MTLTLRSNVTPASPDLLDAAVIITTETAFATPVIEFAAGELITDKVYEVVVVVIMTGTGGPTSNYKLRIGSASGTTLCDIGAATHPNVTNRTSEFVFRFYGLAAAGAAANVLTTVNGVAPGTTPRNTTAQPVAGDTATGFSVVMTCTFSAGTAGNTAKILKKTAREIS